MAKRDKFHVDKPLTLQVNDVVLEYLEDLAKTGLYGNTHQQAAEIVLRHGLKQLIGDGVLTIKDRPLKDDD